MSKKIIYLLSLLMALSLVFASCKKNSVTDALGGGNQPPTEENNDGGSGDNGLYENSDSMPTDDVVRRTTIFNGTLNGNYQRNPVIVAGRDGAVFIFFEIRYERAGAQNDVGIDGTGKVDIGYVVSANAGKDKFNNSTIKYVNQNNSATTEVSKSHGAPVVYYLPGTGSSGGQDKIVIVASAGAGIGRTTQEVLSSSPSHVDYIVGTISDSDKTSITWGDWIKIEAPNLASAVPQIKTGNQKYNMSQWGTHASRGAIINSKLILPVVVAQQGTSGAGKELMGVYLLEGAPGDGNTVNWSDATSAVKVGYKDNAGSTSTYTDFGQWKETQVVAQNADETAYDVLVIPSPQGRQNNNILGKHTSSGNVETIGLPASEGSFGYLITDKWYGSTPYTVSEMGSQTPMILYSHVQSQATKLTLYLLDQNRQNAKKIELGATGKSSSVDMLPDGTVVLAAENTKDGDGYFMQFERRTQAKIVELAK